MRMRKKMKLMMGRKIQMGARNGQEDDEKHVCYHGRS